MEVVNLLCTRQPCSRAPKPGNKRCHRQEDCQCENPGGTRSCASSRRRIESQVRHYGGGRATGVATVISRRPGDNAAIFPTVGRSIFPEQCAGKCRRECFEHVSSSARGK